MAETGRGARREGTRLRKPNCVTCKVATVYQCPFCKVYKKVKVPLCESPACRERHEETGECARKA